MGFLVFRDALDGNLIEGVAALLVASFGKITSGRGVDVIT